MTKFLDTLKQIPGYPLLIAIFPVLSLFALNVSQVSPHSIWRPLLASFLLGLSCLVFYKLLTHDWNKAGLLATLLLFLFFTFGHLYTYLKSTDLVNLNIVRYRYLAGLYLVVFALGNWLILKFNRSLKKLNTPLTVLALALLVMPIYQILANFIGTRAIRNDRAQPVINQAVENLTALDRPDVYYIILDGYARADDLEQTLQYDNSAFIEQLGVRGFYIASCSRSNYNQTSTSMASSLNYDYYPELEMMASEAGIKKDEIWRLIRSNLVRVNFEALGYEIVSFDTGVAWSRWEDADIYLQLWKSSLSASVMTSFEVLWLDTTPLSIYLDFLQKKYADRYVELAHPYGYFINQQKFILDELPAVARVQNPTFTFVHIFIPHPPMVFSPHGVISDPAYFSERYGWPVDYEHLKRGYVEEIEYLNERLLKIIDAILENSEIPPIIILQGDHGIWDEHRIPALPILNAIYFPGLDRNILYPDISPVNTFRLLFHHYFGFKLDLLADRSYRVQAISTPVPELSLYCVESLR